MKLAPLFLLFAATTLSAQKIQETIEVSIVNVDVVVTDKKGNRVTGLTEKDFEIYDSGKPQPITNFAEYASAMSEAKASSEAPAEAKQPAAAATPRAPRIITVFVEWARITPFQSKTMFDGLRDFLHKTVAPGDRATIVSWNGVTLVRQPFTDDLPSLDAALAKLEKEFTSGGRDMDAEVRRAQAEADADAATMEAGGMPPVDALDAAHRQLEQIRQKAYVLQAIMQGISGLEGKKTLVMVMRRFGAFAGAEFFGGEIPTLYRPELSTQKIHDQLVQTANAHGVTLYPVYPVGRRFTPDDASVVRETFSPDADLQRGALEGNVLMNEAMALEEIAKKTGGVAAEDSKNIADMLVRVAGDMDNYYSLGYRAQQTGKDRSRDIVVKVKNPNYEVRSRKQYVEKSDESRMNDRVIASLYQPLQGSTIPFDVGFGKIESRGRNRWVMPIKLRIPIKNLTSLPAGSQMAGEFSVYVITGGVIGVTSEVTHQTQSFRIPRQDVERAQQGHFTYDFTLSLDAKSDRVAIGVLDETSKEYGLKRLALPQRPK